MIILTKDQANQVRGHHLDGHALAPRPFKQSGTSDPFLDGKLGLPEEILNDLNHDDFWDLLSTFPTVPDDSIVQGEHDPLTDTWIVQPDWETDPVLLAPHDYSSDWPVGEIIVV